MLISSLDGTLAERFQTDMSKNNVGIWRRVTAGSRLFPGRFRRGGSQRVTDSRLTYTYDTVQAQMRCCAE